MLKGRTVVKRQGNYKPNAQFISSIRGLYFTVNYLGIWPRAKSRYGYNLIWYVHWIGLVFYSFGLIAGLIVQMHDASKFIDSMGLLIPTVTVCLKWAIFSKHKETVDKLFYLIERDWINLEKNNFINQSVPDSKRIMETYSRSAKIFLYTYLTALTMGVINYVRDFLGGRKTHDIDTDLDKLLPIPNTWYPLDNSRMINIQFLAVVQIITAMTVILANSSMDCFFITVILHLCGQFTILKDFIIGIKYDSSRPDYCTRKVRLMVERHQEMLRFSGHLQEMYSFIILVQFMACTLTICFLGYAFIAEMERSDHVRVTVLLKIGFICGATLMTIFCYCFAGGSLTNESMAIAIAVYNAEWYNCTRSIRLSFLLVMTRAGRPVEMTGAKLLPLSLESFMVIMKTAASYLSVLRAVGVDEGWRQVTQEIE